MTQQRLDQAMVARGLVATRSQAESYIKLGEVRINGEVVTKPGYFVHDNAELKLTVSEQYVSRAALKLASVAAALKLNFRDKIMLDVGSSTGGFTDYALKHGARKVIDIEIGTGQLHPSLRGNPKIELHEQTDIRNVTISRTWSWKQKKDGVLEISESPDIVVIDVSFISLREILPHIAQLSSSGTDIIAMVKPQFEATAVNMKHKGVIKNDHVRRDILKNFESWATNYFVIVDKADSEVAGGKGNRERFYKLRLIAR